MNPDRKEELKLEAKLEAYERGLIEEGINRRESRKNVSFLSFVLKSFEISKYETIYDLCCGKGILGRYFSSLGKDVIAVDHHQNRYLREHPFQETERYHFQTSDLWEEYSLQPYSLVLSLHACGNLTDRVIELSVASQSDVAVMTCCHEKRIFFPDLLEGTSHTNEDKSYRQDRIRVNYLSKQGYETSIFTVPEDITPKNRILLGKYRS
ncbi:MAG: methyltransferase [Nanoarchaeota archaeon]